VRDPLDRAARDPKLLSDRAGLHPGAQQLLHGMAIQHPEHPPRASGDRDFSSHRERPNEIGKLSVATEFSVFRIGFSGAERHVVASETLQ
jgi:hypothetical protein